MVIPQEAEAGQQVARTGMQEYDERLDKVEEELRTFLKSQAEGNPDSTQLDAALSEANRVTKVVLEELPSSLRKVVRPLLESPLQGVSTNVRTAEDEALASRFSSGVCESFGKKLQGRYPFANTDNDALMQDVSEVFGRQGSVWKYFEANLKDRLELAGDGYKPRGDRRVPGNILSFINKAYAVTQALYPQGSQEPKFDFDVRPHPAIVAEGSGYLVAEIMLEVDGKSKTYRNGPRDWWTFGWPGTARKGARLLIRGNEGLSEEVKLDGDWGLLRLIDRGRVQKRGSWYLVEWSLKRGKIRIQMDFKPRRTDNPLMLRSTALRSALGCR
jgi:type VI secretion system protein ImpL